jgi:hypothetical protein
MCRIIIRTIMNKELRILILGTASLSRGTDGPTIKIHYSSIEPVVGEDDFKGAQQAVADVGRHIHRVRVKQMEMPPQDVVVVFAKWTVSCSTYLSWVPR